MRRTTNTNKGFTLIELVVVIVILGILAATALPKFVNLGRDARVAAVNNLAGAIKAAAELAHMKCLAATNCNDNGSGGAGGGPITSPTGAVGYFHYGYPTGQSRLPGYFGIKDWVDTSGFTINDYTASTADIMKDGAEDPNQCKVTYREPAGAGKQPTITIVLDKC